MERTGALERTGTVERTGSVERTGEDFGPKDPWFEPQPGRSSWPRGSHISKAPEVMVRIDRLSNK